MKDPRLATGDRDREERAASCPCSRAERTDAPVEPEDGVFPAAAIAAGVFAAMILARFLPAPPVVGPDDRPAFDDDLVPIRIVIHAVCTWLGVGGFLLGVHSSTRLAAREDGTTPRAIAILAIGIFTIVAGVAGAAWAPGNIQAGPDARFIDADFLPAISMIACCVPTFVAGLAGALSMPPLAMAAFLVGWRDGRSAWEAATYLLLLASTAILYDLFASLSGNIS